MAFPEAGQVRRKSREAAETRLRSRDDASVLLALHAGGGNQNATEIHQAVLPATLYMEQVSGLNHDKILSEF
jgi:hypothetical protein